MPPQPVASYPRAASRIVDAACGNTTRSTILETEWIFPKGEEVTANIIIININIIAVVNIKNGESVMINLECISAYTIFKTLVDW